MQAIVVKFLYKLGNVGDSKVPDVDGIYTLNSITMLGSSLIGKLIKKDHGHTEAVNYQRDSW